MKENDINLNSLLHIAGVSTEKILYKKKPTVLAISDKRLLKMNPLDFIDYNRF